VTQWNISRTGSLKGGQATECLTLSRGSHVDRDHQPQRSDRHGRLPRFATSREAAKPRRRQGVAGVMGQSRGGNGVSPVELTGAMGSVP